MLEISMDVTDNVENYLEQEIRRSYGNKELNRVAKKVKRHLRNVLGGLEAMEYVAITAGAMLDDKDTCLAEDYSDRKGDRAVREALNTNVSLFNYNKLEDHHFWEDEWWQYE